ncbi:MAG: T9SS type A sorting domain-containing protein, partial [Bacteroidota bacterium]
AIMSPSRENIDVYPNPASDIIRIDTRPGESFGFPFKAIVTDILGKEKSLVVFDGNNAEVDITSFDEGVYLIQIIDTDGKTENKRFMKR